MNIHTYVRTGTRAANATQKKHVDTAAAWWLSYHRRREAIANSTTCTNPKGCGNKTRRVFSPGNQNNLSHNSRIRSKGEAESYHAFFVSGFVTGAPYLLVLTMPSAVRLSRSSRGTLAPCWIVQGFGVGEAS